MKADNDSICPCSCNQDCFETILLATSGFRESCATRNIATKMKVHHSLFLLYGLNDDWSCLIFNLMYFFNFGLNGLFSESKDTRTMKIRCMNSIIFNHCSYCFCDRFAWYLQINTSFYLHRSFVLNLFLNLIRFCLWLLIKPSNSLLKYWRLSTLWDDRE